MHRTFVGDFFSQFISHIGHKFMDMNEKRNLESNIFLSIALYYINADEIPVYFLLLKNHIFIARSEDTIFILRV